MLAKLSSVLYPAYPKLNYGTDIYTRKLIQHGEYLAKAGNCITCHTYTFNKNAMPYAMAIYLKTVKSKTTEIKAAKSVTLNSDEKHGAVCHNPGTADAPKPNDTSDWVNRIKPGINIVYEQVIYVTRKQSHQQMIVNNMCFI